MKRFYFTDFTGEKITHAQTIRIVDYSTLTAGENVKSRQLQQVLVEHAKFAPQVMDDVKRLLRRKGNCT